MLEGLVASLAETWPLLTATEVAKAVVLASLTEVFTAPPVLTLDNYRIAA